MAEGSWKRFSNPGGATSIKQLPLLRVYRNNTHKAANGTFTASWNFHQAGSPYQVVSDIILDSTEYGKLNAQYPVEYQPANGAAVDYIPTPGWREWHAESLAIQASSDVNGDPYYPMLPDLVVNGYFKNTALWAKLEYNTGLPVTAASPYPGQTPLPAGWVDIKVH